MEFDIKKKCDAYNDKWKTVKHIEKRFNQEGIRQRRKIFGIFEAKSIKQIEIKEKLENGISEEQEYFLKPYFTA